MITLNGERGLVRLETWDDVETQPGYAKNINPKEVELDSIIGSYRLPELVVCGLSTCHHKHFRGYLVATKDKRVTNIGKDCGFRHFGVDFNTLTAMFDRDMRNKERREVLHAFKNRLEEYAATVERLKTEPKGGTWLNRQMTDLLSVGRGVPEKIRTALNGMIKTGSNTLTRQRLATAQEIEVMRAMENPTPDKKAKADDEDRDETQARKQKRPPQVMIEEEVGTLIGLSVMYPENDIRNILVIDLEEHLKEFRAFDVDTATPHELGRWAKWVGDIDVKLKTCRDIIDIGRQFFDRENIAKLAELAENEKDESRVMEVARRY